MKFKFTIVLAVLSLSIFLPGFQQASASAGIPEDNNTVRAHILATNAALADQGYNIAIEEIAFFTIGNGRSSVKIHQQPFRWVPNDPNRAAQGNDLTYLVDLSDVSTSSGLSSAATEGAIDRAMSTWDNLQPLRKVDLVKRADGGGDPDIYDAIVGFGDLGFGNFVVADIVFGGWFNFGFSGLLAFSVTFIWTDGNGNPTDIDGNNYLDTALNEVYFNDAWGDVSGPFPWNSFGWGININFFDVETVALHESGHSLGIGHFDGPTAVMNAFYGGILHTPQPIDQAGMAIVYNSWPQ